jgi:citrate lyase subunit beta / citryl-CoA lyase
VPPIRSLLYVPADRPDRAAKAFGLTGDGAPDGVILDLEDGVAPTARAAARDGLADLVALRSGGIPLLFVRVNSGAALADDVDAVTAAVVDGVILPKATVASVDTCADLLATAGTPLPITALIESAAGWLDAATIARHPAVARLAIGEADLTADLAMAPSTDGRELLPLRLQMVVASAAAAIDAPTGPVSTDFRDLDALESSTRSLRALGFGSRSAIHPAQVPVINRAFTPTADERARARELVELFDRSVAAGDGAVVGPDGRMVDEAVVRHARRLLDD